MKMSNTVYDLLKYIVIIVLDALSVFYVSMAATWGWPLANEVRDTIDAVSVLMASILLISAADYTIKTSISRRALTGQYLIIRGREISER